jgi:hypothetical protein
VFDNSMRSGSPDFQYCRFRISKPASMFRTVNPSLWRRPKESGCTATAISIAVLTQGYQVKLPERRRFFLLRLLNYRAQPFSFRFVLLITFGQAWCVATRRERIHSAAAPALESWTDVSGESSGTL